MKKLITLLLTVLLLLNLTACGENLEKDVVGIWTLQKITYEGKTYEGDSVGYVYDDFVIYNLVFYKDRTFLIQFLPSREIAGRWGLKEEFLEEDFIFTAEELEIIPNLPFDFYLVGADEDGYEYILSVGYITLKNKKLTIDFYGDGTVVMEFIKSAKLREKPIERNQ